MWLFILHYKKHYILPGILTRVWNPWQICQGKCQGELLGKDVGPYEENQGQIPHFMQPTPGFFFLRHIEFKLGDKNLCKMQMIWLVHAICQGKCDGQALGWDGISAFCRWVDRCLQKTEKAMQTAKCEGHSVVLPLAFFLPYISMHRCSFAVNT